MLEVTLQWISILSRESAEIFLVTSFYRNRDKLLPGGPLCHCVWSKHALLGSNLDLRLFSFHFLRGKIAKSLGSYFRSRSSYPPTYSPTSLCKSVHFPVNSKFEDLRSYLSFGNVSFLSWLLSLSVFFWQAGCDNFDQFSAIS